MQCSNHKKCNNKNYYLLLILSSSYKCDRDCPFCTAKITQLEEGKNNWIELENQLDIIQKNSIVFDHVTIGGNGEPSLNSYDDLKYLKKILDKNNYSFGFKKFETSGNIFFEDQKYKLFEKDYIFDITRVSADDSIDMQILKYKRNYTQADTFKNATISIGHALLKNNINNLNNDIKLYFLRFPNLKSLKIKFLHFYPNLINQNKTKNPYREWVLANSILNTHKNVDSVIRTLSNEFTIIDKKNRYEWNTESGKKIYLSVVKSSLENETIYFYRGTLSEY